MGGQDIKAYDSPGGSEVETVLMDTLVTVSCHLEGTYVSAPAGGTDSSDWDRMVDGNYIPDAYLLTGSSSGSPAPPCSQDAPSSAPSS